ncbi:ricin-type beta-trefoil lectin domain protein [Catelliglobosispora koreensis]|uniref:ricin-type beta-trefoil lectin domain protein n=1 Tax=Catelliglobosispora koreensis TaxID=129052 RepID=UPI00039F57F7
MRFPALAGVVLLSATLAVLPAGAGQASSTDDMFAAMRRDLNLTQAQVRVLLAHEAAAAVNSQRVQSSLGERFAGAWFDGRLRAGVTSDADAQRARQLGAEPVRVRWTLRQLETGKSALDQRQAGAQVHSWYTDVTANRVVVTAASAEAAGQFTRGLDPELIKLTVSAAAPRPLYDTRGGDQFVINGNTLCSIGFAVAGGFVTAGHCGGVNSPTLGYNNVSQGTFRGSSFPVNDYAWVQTNGNWVSRPWVNNYAGGNVGVAGSQEAAIGSSICRSGRTTGWRCGVIQAKNITVNYGNGALVYGLTQSNACAEPGDSGGSWISGNQAQGITSGGSGNCSSGGTTFFQPVNEVLGAYGLSLTTTGGGGTSRIIGYANKCIDVPGGNGVDGALLQLWDCNGTAAQNWTFPGDGTIRAFGLCMDVAWGSTANGAAIQLAHCSGNPAQQFVLSGAGDLVNPQSNKCVDVSGWNSANGTKLIQWECHGGANQKWWRG